MQPDYPDLHRGDKVRIPGYDGITGVIKRLARDRSWADVTWTQLRSPDPNEPHVQLVEARWTKRQPDTRILQLIEEND